MTAHAMLAVAVLASGAALSVLVGLMIADVRQNK
jgi:hypothetical protein